MFLRDPMGLWPLGESLSLWRETGRHITLDRVLREVMKEPALASVTDPSHPMFLPSVGMPVRIARFCEGTGQPVPTTPPAAVRATLESPVPTHADSVRVGAS